MGTIKHPTAVVVHRREPMRDRHFTPQMAERLPVNVEVETAPKPIDNTTFYGVGRDAQHAWPHIHRYTALAIADKLSIMAPNFLIPKVLSAMIAPGTRVGGQAPMTEHVNIKAPAQQPYGSKVEFNPPPTYAPQYAKLI